MAERRRSANDYIKYSTLAFNLAALIFISVWLGKKVDNYFNLKVPIFTMGFILLSFTGFMYKLYKELNERK